MNYLSFFWCVGFLNWSPLEGMIIVVSEATNETVFSAEDTPIDSLSAYGLEGHLVISSPFNACAPVLPPPTPTPVEGPPAWILLVTALGDDCSLAQKTRAAQEAGYAGVIIRTIGKNRSSSPIPDIGLDWVGIRIYGCLVGDDVGLFLERYAAGGGGEYFVRFENEPYYPLGMVAKFIMLGLFGLCIILILARLFHFFYRSVTTSVVERRRRKKMLLSESQLKKLPVLQWSSSIPQDTCSICIELFEQEELVRVLPCSHVFHKNCIDPWLLKESRKCPNCKGRVLFPNERGRYSYSDEDDDEGDVEGVPPATERTPLLPSHRENYRFVDALMESHNNRALQEQYLQDEPSSNAASSSSPRKVSFCPAVSVRSSSSTSGSSSGGGGNVEVGASASGRKSVQKAFVLPMGAKAKPQKLMKQKQEGLRVAEGRCGTIREQSKKQSQLLPQQSIAPPISILKISGASGGDSLSSSEDTLIDFHDLPESNGSTASTDSRSFHSCTEFESEYPSFEGQGQDLTLLSQPQQGQP